MEIPANSLLAQKVGQFRRLESLAQDAKRRMYELPIRFGGEFIE